MANGPFKMAGWSPFTKDDKVTEAKKQIWNPTEEDKRKYYYPKDEKYESSDHKKKMDAYYAELNKRATQ